MDDGLPQGHLIGHHRVVLELGRGGFGITYLAQDTRLDRRVAIKEYFPPGWASRTDNGDVVPRASNADNFKWGLERFGKEYSALRQFDHPNIVRVHCYIEQGGTGYIVMEFVEGDSLSKRLKRQKTLPEADIRQYVLPIMDALAAMHGEGLLHLDIAPKNIMLAPRGRGVLLDFGAARPVARAATGDATILMTPSYAALEQHNETSQSAATDIYSLGAVLYRCVTGHPPWHPTRRVPIDRMPQASDAKRQQDYCPKLLRMIDGALAVRSEDRPKSVGEWRRHLATSGVAASSGDGPGAVTGRIATDGTGHDIRELADEGDMDSIGVVHLRNAQYWVGCLYADRVQAGRDDADDVEARFWLGRAAAQGHLRAHYRLHRMSADGIGGKQDRSAAAEWETKAWQADARTQCRLGVSCREEGADDEAEFWYRGAAYQGDVDAQFALGTLYWDRWAEGKVVDAGVEASLQWCMERAEQGSSWAGVFLADAIDVGLAGGPELRDADTEMGRFLKEPYAAQPWSIRCSFGDGPKADFVWHADCATFCLAYKYLRMAARQGHPEAREFCDRLGVFMLKHALDDRGWHHAFLTDLAVETMTRGDAEARCRVG